MPTPKKRPDFARPFTPQRLIQFCKLAEESCERRNKDGVIVWKHSLVNIRLGMENLLARQERRAVKRVRA